MELPEKYKRKEMSVRDAREDQVGLNSREYTRENILDELDRFCKESGRLWLKDISLVFGVSWGRFLDDWGGDEEFNRRYECCLQVQESRAVRYGMVGELDKNMVMRVLEEKHGWSKREGGNVTVVMPSGDWMERLRERVVSNQVLDEIEVKDES